MAEATSPTKESKAKPENYLFVVSLDFGTTYSGYAFSSRSDFENNPLSIHTIQESRAGGSPLISLKTSTSILIKKDGSFVAFGYEAEDKFYSEMENNQRKEVMLFRRFKMKLYNKMVINDDLSIEDVRGTEYSAKHVFTLSIRALVDDFKKAFKKQNLSDIKDGDIKWVLTVPAIWSDTAKKFMRRCARDAGIQDEMVLIALEPEAASIFVQYLPMERNTNGFGMTKEGTKYMVVDIGGGTADITVHEKVKGGKLRELHKATGGACGGTAVDDAFERRLTEILGTKVMKSLREERTETYLDIFREFEIAKRGCKPDSAGSIRMSISYVTLNELCKEIEKRELKDLFKSIEGMSLIRDKLHINAETMKQFFDPPIRKLIQHMKSILDDPQTNGIAMILLVGGSADSAIIQSEVEKAFESVKLVVPPEAGLAVLKGAVIFGHSPTIIMSRILRFTYGTYIAPEFDPKIHREEKKITVDGVDRCQGVFSSIITAGTEVTVGHKIEQGYSTASMMQIAALVKIFCSPRTDVKYTDDQECFELGELLVPLPGHLLAGLLLGIREYPFAVEYIFGDTELKMTAIEILTGEKTSCTLEMKEDSNKKTES